jgi:hypothetical protein
MTTKTKSKFGAAMFDSIKAALNKGKESSGQFSNIMKFPAGHTYTLRLIPNVENPEKTFFHHWVHGWNSKATGSYMSFLGLQTIGERDPIAELRWKLYKAWKEANPKADNKEYEAEIGQREQWLINVYVVEDPANPENNGTVKILRMGPQLKEIIDDAIEGNRADELGMDIFDLESPHDFKIVAEKQGDFTTFKKSFFTTKSKLKLSEEEIEKIYEDIHDLEAIYTVKTFDELQDALNEHFFVGEEKEERKPLSKAKREVKREEEYIEDPDDDIPMFHDTDKKAEVVEKKTKKEEKQNDDDIDELLAGLDD